VLFQGEVHVQFLACAWGSWRTVPRCPSRRRSGARGWDQPTRARCTTDIVDDLDHGVPFQDDEYVESRPRLGKIQCH